MEVYAEEARHAARAADLAIGAGHAVGPLHGIPVALKDLIEIEGKIVTCGSEAWNHHRATCTATLARHLVGQGMIVIGKTHTVEFAMFVGNLRRSQAFRAAYSGTRILIKEGNEPHLDVACVQFVRRHRLNRLAAVLGLPIGRAKRVRA